MELEIEVIALHVDDIYMLDTEYVSIQNAAEREREIEEYYLACWADEMDAREQELKRMEGIV